MNLAARIVVLCLCFMAPSVYAVSLIDTANNCEFEDLNPLHARLTTALLGNTGAAHFAKDALMRDTILSATSEQMAECSKPIPYVADTLIFSVIAIFTMITLAWFSYLLAGVATNAGANFLFSKDNSQSDNQPAIKIVLYSIGIGLFTPNSPILTINGAINGEPDIDNIYSPAAKMLIKLFANGQIAAQGIDDAISGEGDVALSPYKLPNPEYVSRGSNSGKNEGLGAIINYIDCLGVKRGSFAFDDIKHITRINDGSAIGSSYGLEGSSCFLKISTTPDNSLSALLESHLKSDGIEHSDEIKRNIIKYESSQSEVLNKLTDDLVKFAIEYQTAFYKKIQNNEQNVQNSYLQPLIRDDWASYCDDIGSIFDDKQLPIISSELIKTRRYAELCMSQMVVRRLAYPKGYVYGSGDAYLYKDCKVDDVSGCLSSSCNVDTLGAQSGLFECSTVIKSSIDARKLEHIYDLGFVARPSLLSHEVVSRKVAPEPQKILSNFTAKNEENMSGSHLYHEPYRTIFYLIRTQDFGVLPYVRETPPATKGEDIFGMLPFTNCLTHPNRVIYDDSGQVDYQCGSVIYELKKSGEAFLKLWVAFFLGTVSGSLATKFVSGKEAKMKSAQAESGGVGEGDKSVSQAENDKNNPTGKANKDKGTSMAARFGGFLMAVGLGSFAGLALYGVDEAMSVPVDTPYSLDNPERLLGLSETSGFLLGAIMGSADLKVMKPMTLLFLVGLLLGHFVSILFVVFWLLGVVVGYASFVIMLALLGVFFTQALFRKNEEVNHQFKKIQADVFKVIFWLPLLVLGFKFAVVMMDWFTPIYVQATLFISEVAIPDDVTAASIFSAFLFVVLFVGALMVTVMKALSLIYVPNRHAKTVLFAESGDGTAEDGIGGDAEQVVNSKISTTKSLLS